MKIEIPKETKIVIIEGIAGSGKTTLRRFLRHQFKNRAVFEFKEEELFLSWKHIHMPRVSALRLAYLHRFLDYLEDKLKEGSDSLFILERFHLSLKLLEWEFEDGFEADYQSLLTRLKRLPIYILIVELTPSAIRERMYHRERSRQWIYFIKEKLALRGFEDLESLSIIQQKNYFKLATEQGMPFAAVHVELDNQGT